MTNNGESEIQSLLDQLGTHPAKGLSEVDAYNRLRRFGTNELERPYLRFRQARLCALFCIATGTVLAAEGELPYAVGAAIAGLGLLVLALIMRGHCRPTGYIFPGICTGIRGGRLRRLPVSQLVPGDIVRIQLGETIPADGRLIEAVNLIVQEEIISGSKDPVQKDALCCSELAGPPEMSKNCVYMHTVVIRGRGTFVVTATGRNTRTGKLKVLARKQ